MVGIPIGKTKLRLDKVELENDMTLADLHFSKGRTLNLRSDMQIFIRVPSGKFINCRVDGSYTAQNVQEMIEEQEGIHIRSQRSHLRSRCGLSLPSLDDYNIKEDAYNSFGSSPIKRAGNNYGSRVTGTTMRSTQLMARFKVPP
ncbi:hypothetical protein IFM89_030193 [Coptis chinensis]|uniref:Ubiquitin-like domain-containing protein n=1 Tax=Coptis chinensis TaxID=261450 RepID=A0A835H1X2_9MAGN|nr:hypothetical protein IFM89_030193 [Coptis chinensis]